MLLDCSSKVGGSLGLAVLSLVCYGKTVSLHDLGFFSGVGGIVHSCSDSRFDLLVLSQSLVLLYLLHCLLFRLLLCFFQGFLLSLLSKSGLNLRLDFGYFSFPSLGSGSFLSLLDILLAQSLEAIGFLSHIG